MDILDCTRHVLILTVLETAIEEAYDPPTRRWFVLLFPPIALQTRSRSFSGNIAILLGELNVPRAVGRDANGTQVGQLCRCVLQFVKDNSKHYSAVTSVLLVTVLPWRDTVSLFVLELMWLTFAPARLAMIALAFWKASDTLKTSTTSTLLHASHAQVTALAVAAFGVFTALVRPTLRSRAAAVLFSSLSYMSLRTVIIHDSRPCIHVYANLAALAAMGLASWWHFGGM